VTAEVRKVRGPGGTQLDSAPGSMGSDLPPMKYFFHWLQLYCSHLTEPPSNIQCTRSRHTSLQPFSSAGKGGSQESPRWQPTLFYYGDPTTVLFAHLRSRAEEKPHMQVRKVGEERHRVILWRQGSSSGIVSCSKMCPWSTPLFSARPLLPMHGTL
jgi:hypothetical protein